MRLAAVVVWSMFIVSSAAAQTFGVGAAAAGVWTRADPVATGVARDEIRLLQPVVAAHFGFWDGRGLLLATANFEGLTIPDGELAPGDWGEGFVDRRHPHTYAHELMASLGERIGGSVIGSIAVGKGFAPFGTDDPMIRPMERYPVNHHLAQILERAVAIGAVRLGPVVAELGAFNGDEPERPGQWPRIGGRFGDSWSGRLTVSPLAGLELQGSHAKVHSPEHRPGAGTDQYKWSASARWNRQIGGGATYGLIEWARTSEAGGFFVFHSVLGEASTTRGRHGLAYRFERTERPEEERGESLDRSQRPHLENSILGVTRWTVHTVQYAFSATRADSRIRVGLQPFVEVSLGRVADVGGGVFDSESFYGKRTFSTVSVGMRAAWGRPMHRMGRYGAAATNHEH